MIILRVEERFSATHQITIAGELEPVHGHEFRCVAEFEVDDTRDASTLQPTVRNVLAQLSHTDLAAAGESGHPSAERIASFIHQCLRDALPADGGARARSVAVEESPGCFAAYFESD